MKKALMILLFCAMLTGCGNSDKEAAAVTTAVSHETVTTTTAASVSETTELTTTEISAENTDATAGKTSTSETTTGRSVTTKRETGTTTRTVTESTVSSQTVPERVTETEMPKTVTESRQTTAAKPAVTTTARSTTTTTTAKPKQSVSEKPKVTTTTTTTTAKPKETTTKSRQEQYDEELAEIIERHGWGIGSDVIDITCLDTMVLNLKYSDTPPSYYEKIGKGLKHDGTDYGKAAAVYKWMRKNGWGSCVYYSMETYFVCKGIGLECAYNFTTENGWYGHTHNVVKVDGTWYVFDTQARRFLDNTVPSVRMFDGNDKDMTPFERYIWYDYDENGEHRDWTFTIE